MQSKRNLFQLALLMTIGACVLLLPLWGVLRPASLRGLGPKTARPDPTKSAPADPRLRDAYRFDQAGWMYVHLEGAPDRVGFQHGYLLAPEIADAFEAVKLSE